MLELYYKRIFVLLLVGCFVAGCGTENPFSRGPEVLVGDTDVMLPTGNVSFKGDITPILSRCAGCHQNGTGGWTYSGGSLAYDEAISSINTLDPERSLLLIKASGGEGHGGGTVFSVSSVQYRTLVLWIEQGAENN